MMLRHYQKKAVDSCIDWFCDGKDKPLIVLPTGTGKSIVAAELCRDIVHHSPHARVVVAAHVKELVGQNYEKFLSVANDLTAGIVSAGLNKKEYSAPILFGSIQSMYRNADKIGHIDVLIVDEAHVIPPTGQGMWRTFEKNLRAINPNFRMCGMTATPFRMTSGNLIGGSDPQFNGICYEYKIIDAIKEGYLSEIVSAPTEQSLSVTGVAKRGGEFIESELQKAVNVDEKTIACCHEIIEKGKDRNAWLIFSSGNEHAQKIHDYLHCLGLKGYCITQETSHKERDRAVRELNSGECRYIVNNIILTTGFDCPRLDLIACMRPTQSPGLWVQMCGRGTRLFNGKENCLLLDFGRNIERHGALDQISGSEYIEKKEKGEAPVKKCPACEAMIHSAARVCPECEYVFPERELNITSAASSGAVLSYQNQVQQLSVLNMDIKRHFGKNGKPDSLRIIYTTFSGQVSEFLFYDHHERTRAFQNTVRKHGFYPSVAKALEGDWEKPDAIKVIKNGKYFNVVEKIFYET